MKQTRGNRRRAGLGRVHGASPGRSLAVLLACHLFFLLAFGGSARDARADGAFPTATAVLLPLDRPATIVVAATFGLIVTEDDGATWHYTCERPESAGGWQYTLGAAPDNRIFAVADTGVAMTPDFGCSWTVGSGDMGEANDMPLVSDVFPHPTDPKRAFIIGSRVLPEIGPLLIYETRDGGTTFRALPSPAPAKDTLSGVEIPRAAPETVYATFFARDTNVIRPRFARSTDGGQTWTSLDLEPLIGSVMPFLAAVDPVDPQTVFLRLTGRTPVGALVESLAISRDGGDTWEVPLVLEETNLTGFLRRTDGTILLTAEQVDQRVGFQSTDGGRTFVNWPLSIRPRGLGERNGVVYAVTEDVVDGATLFTSEDALTWTPRLRGDQILGPKECVRSTCKSDCDYYAPLVPFAADACELNGRDGAASDGAAGGGTGDGGGCGCDAAAGAGRDGAQGERASGATTRVAALGGLLLLGAGALVTVRRRRARADQRVAAPPIVGVVLAALALPAAIGSGGCGREIPAYALDRGFGPTDPMLPGMNGRIVTSNNGDDTLSIVDPDPAATTPAFSLPVGLVPIEPEGPHHIAAAPDGSAVYLNLSRTTLMGLGPHGSHGTSARPGYVLKLDALDGRLLGRVSVDTNPGENALDAAGRTLYVTHYDLAAWTVGARAGDFRQGDSTVIAIDTESMSLRFRLPVCPAAHGARLSRDEKTLYVACAPDEIALVSLDSTPPAVRRVTLPGLSEGAGCVRCPYAVAVAPDDTVWVASLGRNSGVQGGGGVDVFDPKAPALPAGAGQNGADAPAIGAADLAAQSTGETGAFNPTWRLDFIGAAMFPAFLPPDDDGTYRALVPEQGPGGDHLHIYEVAPGTPPVLVESIAFARADCFNAHVADVSPDQANAYLICEGDHKRPGSLVVIDLASRTPIRVVTLGVFPDGMARVPDRQPAR